LNVSTGRSPEIDLDAHEVLALKKAAVWSALAGIALFASTEFAPSFFGTWYSILNALGFGLILPVLASLHVRHALVRQSGAILGTIAGTCVVVLGLSGAPETSPALLIVRTVWWWTIGKMWAETNVMPRGFGWVTAFLAVAFPAAVGIAAIAGRSDPLPDLALRLVFSAWLVVLAAFLWPRRAVA
jgi:hypothetical protein